MNDKLLHEYDQEPNQTEYDVNSMRCYLCDIDFQEGGDHGDPYYLFKKRINDAEGDSFALSLVLSSALGRVLEESEAHSKFVCEKCNLVLNEFELIEQKYYQLKYKIISSFNRMATAHSIEPVEIEISGDIEVDQSLNGLLVEHVEIIKTDDADEIEIEEEEEEEEEEDGMEAEEEEELESTENDTIIANEEELMHEENGISSNGLFHNFKDGDNNSIVINTELNRVKDENLTIEENETYFDHNSGDIVEIITADHPYEQIIGENYQEDSIESESVEMAIHDENNFEVKSDDDNDYQQFQTSSTNSTPPVKRKREKIVGQSTFKFDGSVYTCLLCELNGEFVTESNAKSMSNHLKTIHKSRIYICDDCSEVFAKRSEFNDHKDNAHGSNEDATYKCQTCVKTFTNLRLYRIHKRLHYTNMKNHQCYICDKKYSSKSLLEEHMNMHTGQRPYKCDECGKDFASKYTLHAHKRTHTDRPRPHQCDECEKAFYSAQNLIQHKRLHTGLKEFFCEHCNKAFGSQHNLDVHKIVHTGNKPFICRTCGKAFARRAEIKDHERTHTGEKPFKCNLCPLAFAQRSNLSTHIKATHYNDKSHKCKDCDKSFKRRRLLDYHIQAVHTGERPHKCPHCSASFVYPEHFKKHMRIHTGDKPYSCEVCNKSFNSRDNRNAHRYIHSDKKPYECLICGVGFMRKPLLLTHMTLMNHVNDTIVINEPRIPPFKNENSEWNANENDENEYDEDEQILDENTEIIGTINEEVSLECEYNEVIADSSEVQFINGDDIDSKYIQLSNSGWVSVDASEIDETE